MTDRILIVVDGYGVCQAALADKGYSDAAIRVVFSQTRAQRRELEREVEKELSEALRRARKPVQVVQVFTSKFERDREGNLVPREEQVPEYINLQLVHEEIELRLIDLFERWVEENTWIQRIQDRPDRNRWIRF